MEDLAQLRCAVGKDFLYIGTHKKFVNQRIAPDSIFD